MVFFFSNVDPFSMFIFYGADEAFRLFFIIIDLFFCCTCDAIFVILRLDQNTQYFVFHAAHYLRLDNHKSSHFNVSCPRPITF